MTRRDFRTPPTLPDSTLTRCITIPASQEWLGLVNAALLMLTEEWRYIQVFDTDMTPAATAARAYAMYVQYLGECMDCDAAIQCLLDAGLLGSTIPNGDIRNDGGVPQVSYDGGVTWQDIPGDASADPYVPASVATPGATDEIRKCLAATRAAMVLDEVYQGVYGAVAADIYNSANAFANWLLNVNQQLLSLIYGEAAAVLNAEILRDYSVPTNYTAASLTAGQLDDLICLLLDYATDNPDGIVTFDWGAIRDNMISVMGANPGTALWSIVIYLKNRGLERASQVAITETGDCACDEGWCKEWDFTASDGGFTVQDGYGAYASGQGWYPTQVGGSGSKQTRIRINLPAGDYTIEAAYVAYTDFVRSAGDSTINIQDDGATLYATSVPTAGDADITYSATVSADGWIQLNMATGLSAGAGYFTTLRLSSSTGTSPFGASDC